LTYNKYKDIQIKCFLNQRISPDRETIDRIYNKTSTPLCINTDKQMKSLQNSNKKIKGILKKINTDLENIHLDLNSNTLYH
jgi:hypothetical protein